MNWSAAKIGAIYQKPAQAIGLCTPPIGCGLDLPGLPGGGNKIYDRSPYGNIGTITGATWVRTPGGLWALNFDGTDDYVDCGDILPSAPRVFEFWMKTTEAGSSGILCFEGISRYPGFSILSGKWIIIYDDGRTRYRFFTLTGNDGEWHHFIVYCPAGIQDSKLWVDAQEVSIVSTTGTGDVGFWTSFDIGKNAYGAISCNIGLVRIYHRALSSLEIQNHYQQEKHLFGVW